ncbi:9055_t:CDS:2, partial [Dentiscutata erythropus]
VMIRPILDNKDFLEKCQKWLWQQTPESRFPGALKIYIKKILLPKLEYTKNTISEKTCRTYMYALGYKKEWLERMFTYKKYMKEFVGDMLKIIVQLELEKNEDILCSKHIGHSVIVSAFVCLCHGLLQLSEEQFQANLHVKYKDVFVIHFVQEDRYWKSEHMLEQ